MDGPLVVVMVAYLVVPIVWVYQRFFEAAGPVSLELEARCKARPVLAVLHVPGARAASVARHLQRALGKRRELALSLGGWPWTHHVLRVEVTHTATEVHVAGVGSRVRRARETRVPALTAVLLDALRRFALKADDNWLPQEAYRRVVGLQAPNGWRLLPESEDKFPLEPWPERSPLRWVRREDDAAPAPDERVRYALYETS